MNNELIVNDQIKYFCKKEKIIHYQKVIKFLIKIHYEKNRSYNKTLQI